MSDLQQTAQRGLRLLLEGISLKRGAVPNRLELASDFLVTGLSKGSTKVEVQAPRLGDALEPELLQPDFWREIPGADDSVFTLIGNCLRDAESENLNSDRFDRGVLDSLASFSRFLKHADSLEVIRKDGKEPVFMITSASLEQVEKLRRKTLDPQSMVVSGRLEQITYKTGRFLMELPENARLYGRVHPEFLAAEDLRDLWGKKVSVKGAVHFKHSGVARFIDAELIKLMESSEEIFERLPVAVQLEAPFAALTEAMKSPVDVSEIWGQWPGDESIEELLAEL